ncbi:MAG TPA: EAL domain-containing protein [Chakrabartia sp.]|jgi:diguanylate cyclase (GGDEF)-like protein|nr:EAL domain-containing protein [Chakrabartia sp.]
MTKGSTAGTSSGFIVRLIGLDIVLAAVIMAGTILFVKNAGRMVGYIFGAIDGLQFARGNSFLIAVSLNLALLMIGWRRYRDLSHEVQERKAAEERAVHLSSRDPLTGLLNRRSLCEAGTELLARAKVGQKAVAVILIDLDHFKNVNDVHGHSVGDSLLRTASAIIVDKLPVGALIARLGGDEFACAVMYDEGQDNSVTYMVDQIVQDFGQPLVADRIVVHAGASIGVALSYEDATIEGMIRRADIAMYSAKHAGRNRMAWFDESMERDLQTRNETENAMRAGISKSEFIPYFEQQIDLTTNRITGFEVLARWQHPLRGIVPPDEFIPIAEETGMIGEISEMVIRKALTVAKDWDHAITISVNISPVQLRDPWLAQKMVKLLIETGFPASRLEIEITESALFDNLALAQSIITSLKNQGIRIALDDFGTGYSSLAHLRALPFDRIKIDKSFVMSILDNNESAAIVNAISSLGDSLNLTVTAEGIEDSDIANRLAPMGISKGQGWHYGLPMDGDNAAGMLARQAAGEVVVPSHVGVKRIRAAA